MLVLTNYYFLYQELCVFVVYRSVKKLHSAPLTVNALAKKTVVPTVGWQEEN